MVDKDTMQISISEIKGWLFKQGSDTAWAKKDIDLMGWKRLMPTELSENWRTRMEQSGVLGKINISQYTYEKIMDQFTCTNRDKIEAKNKGDVDM